MKKSSRKSNSGKSRIFRLLLAAVIGAFTGLVTYDPTGPGAGALSTEIGDIIFTGLEPVDFSGSTMVDFVIDLDPGSTFAGPVTTTVAAVDAGVNTDISFGASGLESIKLGVVTGSITINGDNVDNACSSSTASAAR